MNICFFGVGGVGGFIGAQMVKRYGNEHDIYFIARGAHLDVIRTKGLTLKMRGGEETINVSPTLCTDDIGELPVCDLIILSVKEYDLAAAAKQLNRIADKSTHILPLLNGVDIYERIRKYCDKGIVYPSCIYVGTHIEQPGIIYQKGGGCVVYMGADPQYPALKPKELMVLLGDAAVDYSWEANVYREIWSKFVFIVGYGLVTAANGKTLGEIIADDSLSESARKVMIEVAHISRKKGVSLPDDIAMVSFEKGRKFPFETRTSFQRDVETSGKPHEGDLFGGTVIRMGKELGVLTPETERLHRLIQLKTG